LHQEDFFCSSIIHPYYPTDIYRISIREVKEEERHRLGEKILGSELDDNRKDKGKRIKEKGKETREYWNNGIMQDHKQVKGCKLRVKYE
jgi:hypothetical protein